MNKNAQILIGVGVLSAGAFLYWKSTQSTTPAVATTGSIKAIPKDFFDVQSSPNAENNFKNASGNGGAVQTPPIVKPSAIFTPTPSKNVFAHADGFTTTPSEKVFTNFGGDKKIFKKTHKDKVFKNIVEPFATHNSGNSFM